jgi:hypothetical protein
MIGAKVGEVSPTARRNPFGETRRTQAKISADHRSTRPGEGRFGGFSDKTPRARAYKKVKYNTTIIKCTYLYYPEYKNSLFPKKDVQNFGKTSKPLPTADCGCRTEDMIRDVTV